MSSSGEISLREPVLNLLAATAAAGAALWFNLDLSAAGDKLIAIFSILAGLLVQAMLVTATIAERGVITSKVMRDLNGHLARQQRQWALLFGLYLVAALIPVLMSLAHDTGADMLGPNIRVGSITLAFFATLALVRTIGVIRGIQSLQRVRHALLINEIEENEKRGRETEANAVRMTRPIPDVPYNRKISIG